MVALVTGPDGEPAGIQRTFLTDDGRKAASADGKVKFSLGLVRSRAIRLGPVLQDGLALTEWAEDSLSLIQMGAASAWATAGAGMLAGLQLPSDVRSVVIGGGNDEAGRFAAENAAAAMTRRGAVVRVIFPDDGAKDWNESLIGVTA